jgi:NAD(P) transhydrogenase
MELALCFLLVGSCAAFAPGNPARHSHVARVGVIHAVSEKVKSAVGVAETVGTVVTVPAGTPATTDGESVKPEVGVPEAIGSVASSDLAKQYDLVVVGGGPAGVAGALKAAQLGKRVLIVDKPKAAPPGGGLDFGFGGPTGLFSKALRDVAKSLDIGSLDAMGLDNDVIWQQVRNNCLRLAGNNANNVCELLSKFRVGYLQGEATLKAKDGEDSVQALSVVQHSDGKEVAVSTKRVLLCLGSKPTRLGSVPFDDVRVFDSDTVNGLSFLPQSVVITGSGIIAIEYAKIFRKFGAKVTMVVRGTAMSALERIGLDQTVAERLLKGLADEGVVVLENTSIKEFVELPGDGCAISPFDAIGGNSCSPLVMALADKDGNDMGTVKADIYLAAMGRKPVAKGTSIGVEDRGIELNDFGHIKVTETFETSVKNIYAAGDCIEGPALASTGVDQAQRAVSKMFGSSSVAVSSDFPIGMWTIPEIGYYGLTKAAAIDKGFAAEEGIATYDACLRGRVFAPDGMLKLVFDTDSKKILGVHIIGTDACELVHYGMDLVEQKATIFDVIGTLFTAVTFHELFKEAALDGNSKLAFGIQWQEVLQTLAVGLPESEKLDEGQLRQKFDEIDTSGDGSLDPEELKAVFENIGNPVEQVVIENLVYLADEDGNGTVEWDEFQAIFLVLRQMKANGQIK